MKVTGCKVNKKHKQYHKKLIFFKFKIIIKMNMRIKINFQNNNNNK